MTTSKPMSRLMRISSVVALAVLLAAGAQDQSPVPREVPDPEHATCTVDGWWSYARACCCRSGWCAPLPPRTVHRDAGVWVVTLRRGDHPQIVADTTFRIPFRDALRSLDERFHLCTGGTYPRCFLAPTGVM